MPSLPPWAQVKRSPSAARHEVEGRVLHVYKSRVEAREADQLNDLRVGNAADMRAERKPARPRRGFF
jgi:hypothetical protein